jgi:hypothetical protein
MGGKPSRAKRAWRRWPAHGGFLDDRPMDLRSQRGIPIAKSRETVIVSSGAGYDLSGGSVGTR